METTAAAAYMSITPERWSEIARQLRAPFAAREVDFRVQGKPGANGKVQIVAYINARAVEDRLDDVVGAGGWGFDYTPLAVDAKGVVLSAKGTITIYGLAKSDIGDASNFEASKGTVSDALKRAAVLWGVGRYLYDIPATWATVPDGGRIPDALLAELRGKLPRPAATPATAQTTPTTSARTQAAPTPRGGVAPDDDGPDMTFSLPDYAGPEDAGPVAETKPTPISTEQQLQIGKACKLLALPQDDWPDPKTSDDAERTLARLREDYRALMAKQKGLAAQRDAINARNASPTSPTSPQSAAQPALVGPDLSAPGVFGRRGA